MKNKTQLNIFLFIQIKAKANYPASFRKKISSFVHSNERHPNDPKRTLRQVITTINEEITATSQLSHDQCQPTGVEGLY